MAKQIRLKKGPRSWSMLEAYEMCPYSFRLRYIDKIKMASHPAAVFGSAFHEFRCQYYDFCSQQGVDSDWETAQVIAGKAYDQKILPLEGKDEFVRLCYEYAQNRPYNPAMGVEVRFGVNRDGTWSSFDKCNYFRGILDGLTIENEFGSITDAKTSQSPKVPFTQLEIYAAFLAVRYPEVQVWTLVYDFVRWGKLEKREILAENLPAVRKKVKDRIERVESETQWRPEPSERCLDCPYLSRCKYKISGITAPETEDHVRKMISDYYQLKGQAEQQKRIIKKWVENFGTVMTKKHEAAYFPTETKEVPDKAGLVQALKALKRNPLNYLEFTAAHIKALMKDIAIVDDVSSFIFIEPGRKFDIKKRKKEEEE